MENLLENNQVTLVGEVATGFKYSHEVFGEGFYIFELAIVRESNYVDYIPVMVSERLIDINTDIRGRFVFLKGQYRSFNMKTEEKNKLILNAFALEIEVLDNNDYQHINVINLSGYLCKTPVYRKTPYGREITDLLVAVNRGYGKSDYIPCVCWGRNARFASTFEVGTHVQIFGRVQSRPYSKKISDTEFEDRVAYEVSVGKIEL